MILHIGLKGTCTQIIEDAHTAASIGSGSLPVCATPVICALMEHAAVNSVSRCFPAGTTSVGVFLSVSHRAPTLTGHSVTACAELIRTEGRKLTFHIQVSDEGASSPKPIMCASWWNHRLFLKRLQNVTIHNRFYLIK